MISDAVQNTQVYREFWDEKLTQSYYDETRNPENHFTT